MRPSLRVIPVQQVHATLEEQRIVRELMCGPMRWEMRRGIELALFRTFGSPAISALLAQTGKSVNRPQARRAGTEEIIYAMLERGYDSPRGASALEAMNRIHARFRIDNDDHLYVLSALIFEPIRWAQRFGWRELTTTEQDAYFACWRAIGARMGIVGIPSLPDELGNWNQEYERTRFVPDADSGRIAAAVMGAYLAAWPKLARPLGAFGLRALVDVTFLRAIGLEPAPVICRYAAQAILKLRARVVWLFRSGAGASQPDDRPCPTSRSR